jgi:hypothetical protein
MTVHHLTLLFSPGILLLEQHDCHPPVTLLFSFSPIEDKTDNLGVEAESQAMLNTFTDDDFQDSFKDWQKRWEMCICVEWDYIEGDGGQ